MALRVAHLLHRQAWEGFAVSASGVRVRGLVWVGVGVLGLCGLRFGLWGSGLFWGAGVLVSWACGADLCFTLAPDIRSLEMVLQKP